MWQKTDAICARIEFKICFSTIPIYDVKDYASFPYDNWCLSVTPYFAVNDVCYWFFLKPFVTENRCNLRTPWVCVKNKVDRFQIINLINLILTRMTACLKRAKRVLAFSNERLHFPWLAPRFDSNYDCLLTREKPL